MKLSEIPKKMVWAICVLCIFFVLAGIIYYRSMSCLPFVLGVILGSAASVLKVLLLARTVERAMEMEQKTAGKYVGLQHLLRLLFTGVVRAAAAIVPWISLWGAVLGIFSFQISVYILKFSSKT